MAELKFWFFFVWVAAMLVTGWSVVVAREFARRVAREFAKKQGEAVPADAPAVAAILPIKGVEEDTEGNVRALLLQDYPRYRLLFAVESAEDAVIPLLEKIARETVSPKIAVVVAGVATERGQKVQNQLAAVERTTEADEILVFVDADARPKPLWMRELVKPLTVAEDVGATTGFRFYVPANETLANAMLSVINAGVAALLGPGWRNVAWGGSMAIRRKDFLGFGVKDAWQHALSDDYVLSWCVKSQAKRRIQFVQACVVESAADVSWAGFWEFAARQYRITRICAPFIWLLALGAQLLYLVMMVYTISFWVLSLVRNGGGADHPLLLMFLGVYLGNVIRGYFLLRGGLAAVAAESRGRLKNAWFWYTWGYPMSLVINLMALLRSAAGRTIVWRSVRYTMHNRLKTTVHRGGN